ncbi:MAG: hypothetical protein WAL20_10955, partial [Rhodomicrobium sp.]
IGENIERGKFLDQAIEIAHFTNEQWGLALAQQAVGGYDYDFPSHLRLGDPFLKLAVIALFGGHCFGLPSALSRCWGGRGTAMNPDTKLPFSTFSM